MNQRGFTIVEISIVIALIVVLTLLGVASLRSSEVGARDDERQVKAETISRTLESFYQTGDPARGINPGRYPSITEFEAAKTGNYLEEWFDSTDTSVLRFSWQPDSQTNLSFLGSLAAPARDQTETASRIATAVNGGMIVYEPLAIFVGSRPAGDNDAWASCHTISSNTPSCARYNLYFQKESDGSIVTIRSQRQ